jgi:hypothetical protein
MENQEELWADLAGAALLSNALQANTSLCELDMKYYQTWTIPAAGTALLAALTGHPSVRKLDLQGNNVFNERPADGGRCYCARRAGGF